jgi:hypothetical protein
VVANLSVENIASNFRINTSTLQLETVCFSEELLSPTRLHVSKFRINIHGGDSLLMDG